MIIVKQRRYYQIYSKGIELKQVEVYLKYMRNTLQLAIVILPLQISVHEGGALDGCKTTYFRCP